MRVLIIPADQTQDGFIVRPVLQALLKDRGVSARVDVLPEPRLRGVGDALDKAVVDSIVRDNPMIDLFVLVVDRDCDPSHEQKAMAREREQAGKLIACVAVEEIEVWMLALHREALRAPWKDVREECHPKEQFAEPLLMELGNQGPGRGRKQAMRAIRGQLKTLLSLCQELRVLRDRIAEQIESPDGST